MNPSVVAKKLDEEDVCREKMSIGNPRGSPLSQFAFVDQLAVEDLDLRPLLLLLLLGLVVAVPTMAKPGNNGIEKQYM